MRSSKVGTHHTSASCDRLGLLMTRSEDSRIYPLWWGDGSSSAIPDAKRASRKLKGQDPAISSEDFCIPGSVASPRLKGGAFSGGISDRKLPVSSDARPDTTSEAQQQEAEGRSTREGGKHQQHATNSKKLPAAKEGRPGDGLPSKPSRKAAVSRVKQQLEVQRELHRQREAVRKQRFRGALGVRDTNARAPKIQQAPSQRQQGQEGYTKERPPLEIAESLFSNPWVTDLLGKGCDANGEVSAANLLRAGLGFFPLGKAPQGGECDRGMQLLWASRTPEDVACFSRSTRDPEGVPELAFGSREMSQARHEPDFDGSPATHEAPQAHPHQGPHDTQTFPATHEAPQAHPHQAHQVPHDTQTFPATHDTLQAHPHHPHQGPHDTQTLQPCERPVPHVAASDNFCGMTSRMEGGNYSESHHDHDTPLPQGLLDVSFDSGSSGICHVDRPPSPHHWREPGEALQRDGGGSGGITAGAGESMSACAREQVKVGKGVEDRRRVCSEWVGDFGHLEGRRFTAKASKAWLASQVERASGNSRGEKRGQHILEAIRGMPAHEQEESRSRQPGVTCNADIPVEAGEEGRDALAAFMEDLACPGMGDDMHADGWDWAGIAAR